MAFNSTSDNLLNNIVLNTDNLNNLDKGDFPSLVGLIVASTGSNFLIKTQADFIASGAYVFEGDVPVQDIVVFEDVNVSSGKLTSDIDTLAVSLVQEAATDYLGKTGGSRAWIKIKKIELTHLYTGATVIPTNSTATYKLTAEVYNQE